VGLALHPTHPSLRPVPGALDPGNCLQFCWAQIVFQLYIGVASLCKKFEGFFLKKNADTYWVWLLAILQNTECWDFAK
jgi:hypothetical protein